MGVTEVDVVVVGYGPVGAVLAGLLARRGRSVLVVDREVGLFPLPRAAHLDHEVLRVLQELGCAAAVVADGEANRGMDVVDARRDPLLRFTAPPLGPSGWPASLLFHQPALEHRLRDAAVAAGAVVRLGPGAAVTDVSPDALGGVRVVLAGGDIVRAR